MNREPQIGRFLNEDEKAIVKAIEHKDYTIGQSSLTSGRLKELQAAAGATINEERSRISLRVPKTDLSRLKALAMKEGIPYQTLINSILHKAVVNGQ